MKRTIRRRIIELVAEYDEVNLQIVKHHFRGRTNENLDNSVMRKVRLMCADKQLSELTKVFMKCVKGWLSKIYEIY